MKKISKKQAKGRPATRSIRAGSTILKADPPPPPELSTSGQSSIYKSAVAIAWIGFLLSLWFLYCQLSSASPETLKVWVSSDTLYPVNVFTDIFIDRFPLSGWRFSIAPVWFPDLALAGLFFALTRNVVTATLLAGFAQIPLMIAGFQLIRGAIGIGTSAVQDVFLLTAGTLVTIYAAFAPGLGYPFVYKFFLPQTHVGTLLLILYSLGLGLLIIKNNRRRIGQIALIAAYAGLCLLGGMSNLLFFPELLVPLSISVWLAVLLRMLTFRPSFLPVVIGWASAIIGAILNRVLFDTTKVTTQAGFSYERAVISLDTFASGMLVNLRTMDGIHLLALLWTLICLAYLLRTFRNSGLRAGAKAGSKRVLTAVFFSSCLLSGWIGAAAIIAGGSDGLSGFKDYVWSLHYLPSLFLLPLFGVPLALSWALPYAGRPSLVKGVVITLALIAFAVPAFLLASTERPHNSIAHYAPPLVRYMDGLAVKENLKYGLAGYWQARPITMLSTRGLRVYAVDGALNPLLWVSNRLWYSEELGNRSIHPPVDFVILDDPLWKLSREGAVRALGQPRTELVFQGTRVLIYKTLVR